MKRIFTPLLVGLSFSAGMYAQCENFSVEMKPTNTDLTCLMETSEVNIVANTELVSVDVTFNNELIQHECSGTETSVELTEAGSYSFLVKSADGCEFTDELVISKNMQEPTFEFEITDGTQPAIDCQAGSYSAKLYSTSEMNEAVEYKWYLDDEEVGSGTEVKLTASGSYSVVSTAQNGCTFASELVVEACVDEKCKDKSVEISASSDAITCAVESVTLTYKANFEVANASWFNQSSEESVTVEAGGEYFVFVTAKDDCQVEAKIQIDEKKGAVPGFSIDPVGLDAPVLMCDGGSIKLKVVFEIPADAGTDYIAPNPDDYTYQWMDMDGNAISTEMSIEVSEKGIFSVEVRDENGCFEANEIEVEGPDCEVVCMEFDESLSVELTSKVLDCDMESISMFVSSSSNLPSFYWNGEKMENGSREHVATVRGTYWLHAVDGVTGCSADRYIEIYEAVCEGDNTTFVIVDNDATNASITVEEVEGATTYTISVTEEGKPFCTVYMDENREVTGIDYASGVSAMRVAPSAGSGSVVIQNLKPGSSYGYKVVIGGASGTIKEESGSFSAQVATQVDENAAVGVSVIAAEGSIVIQGAADAVIIVTDLAGHTLYQRAANADLVTIPVQQGVYMVRVADATSKVIVP